MGDTEDVFYTKLISDPQFVCAYLDELYKVRAVEKDIVEADETGASVMQSMATDIFGIQEEVISKLIYPQLQSVSNLDTEGNLFLDGMAEHFKMMFTYYGPGLFDHFKPHILKFLEEKTDESKQAVCAEVLSGFLSTVRYYGDLKEIQPKYKEVMAILTENFEQCSDEVNRDWEPAIEYFLNDLDPERFHFMVEDLFKETTLVDQTEHIIVK